MKTVSKNYGCFFILMWQCFTRGWAQALLTHPHIATNLAGENTLYLGSNFTADNDKYGLNIYFHNVSNLRKKYHFYGDFSFHSTWDSVDMYTNAWHAGDFSLGMGRTFQHHHFYAQTSWGGGNYFFRYQYFDQLKRNTDFKTSKAYFFAQYASGFYYKHWEFGSSVKMLGYINWYVKANTKYMGTEALKNYQLQKNSLSGVALEPMLYANIRVRPHTSVNLSAWSTLWQNEYGTFNIAAPIHASVGLMTWF